MKECVSLGINTSPAIYKTGARFLASKYSDLSLHHVIQNADCSHLSVWVEISRLQAAATIQ